MKISFKKEKKFAKESSGINLNLYWRFAVCFMFLVLTASFFFGYYLFVHINKEPGSGSDSEVARTRPIKREKLSEVLEYFSLRKQKSQQILISPAPVIDPSL